MTNGRIMKNNDVCNIISGRFIADVEVLEDSDDSFSVGDKVYWGQPGADASNGHLTKNQDDESLYAGIVLEIPTNERPLMRVEFISIAEQELLANMPKIQIADYNENDY